VTLTVVPGEPSVVTSAEIVVLGPAAGRTCRPKRHRRAKEQLGSAVGAVFRQTAWTSAKERAVAGLAATPYAAAKLVASEAKIDPDARSAALSVSIESGPAFHFGDIDVRGLDRYTPELVKSFATIKPGDLLASGHSTNSSGACWHRVISRACRRRSSPIPSRPKPPRSRWR
jgi:translocation and assembly module TamA